MNDQEFFELSKKTRAAQKLYFKSRLQGDLIAAKNLERELDQAIAQAVEQFVTTIASEEEERQLKLHLEDELDAGEEEKYTEDDNEQ